MDWSFDIRSALLVGALLTVLVGGILLLASRSLPASYRASLNWWVAATLMLPGSFVMLGLRDVAPAWFTMVLGTAAVILVCRAGTVLLDPAQMTSIFVLSRVQVLTYAVGSVLPVIATIGFLLMCTERSQCKLERAARVDFLTDCYNRRAIEELGRRAGDVRPPAHGDAVHRRGGAGADGS